jgi:hypothetical protein
VICITALLNPTNEDRINFDEASCQIRSVCAGNRPWGYASASGNSVHRKRPRHDPLRDLLRQDGEIGNGFIGGLCAGACTGRVFRAALLRDLIP